MIARHLPIKHASNDRDEITTFLLERKAPVFPFRDPIFGSARCPGLTPIVYALGLGREKCRELLLFKKHLCTSQFMPGGEMPFKLTDDLRGPLDLYVSPDVIFRQGHGALDIAILQHDPDSVQYSLENEVRPRLFWKSDSAEVAKFEDQEFARHFKNRSRSASAHSCHSGHLREWKSACHRRSPIWGSIFRLMSRESLVSCSRSLLTIRDLSLEVARTLSL